jgi:hypothetical protein
VIEHIHVEFAVMKQARQREVATAEIAHNGIYGIGTEQHVQFGVKRVAQEQLNDELFCFDLPCQPTQARFVRVVRYADD